MSEPQYRSWFNAAEISFTGIISHSAGEPGLEHPTHESWHLKNYTNQVFYLPPFLLIVQTGWWIRWRDWCTNQCCGWAFCSSFSKVCAPVITNEAFAWRLKVGLSSGSTRFKLAIIQLWCFRNSSGWHQFLRAQISWRGTCAFLFRTFYTDESNDPEILWRVFKLNRADRKYSYDIAMMMMIL